MKIYEGVLKTLSAYAIILDSSEREYFIIKKDSKIKKILNESYKGMLLVEVTEQDYAAYFTWLKEAKEKGWFAEFNGILKAVQKEKEKEKEKINVPSAH